MDEEKRIIPTNDGQGYEVKTAIQLGRREFILAENTTSTVAPFMMCECTWNNPLGVDVFENAYVSDNYLELVVELVSRLSTQVKALESERAEHGLPLQVLTWRDCQTSWTDKDLEGQLVVIKPENLLPEYRSAENQLQIVTGGNGCRANARGQAVFCENLLTGDKKRYERYDVAGIADMNKLPEWAKQKLKEHEKPEKKPSLLAQVEENKKLVSQQVSSKQAKSNSPEL